LLGGQNLDVSWFWGVMVVKDAWNKKILEISFQKMATETDWVGEFSYRWVVF